MAVATDETFGPLAAISSKKEEGVVQMVNSTEFGLAGYCFTRNVGRDMRVARALECGMGGVNMGLMTAVETPFGDVKENGLGIEGSKYGILEYQNIKGITFGNLAD